MARVQTPALNESVVSTGALAQYCRIVVQVPANGSGERANEMLVCPLAPLARRHVYAQLIEAPETEQVPASVWAGLPEALSGAQDSVKLPVAEK